MTKDPDTGRRNLGIRRCQVKGPDKTGILFGAPDRGGAIHHAKWKMRGQSMPAAFYVGADPVHYLVVPRFLAYWRFGPCSGFPAR